MKKVHAPTSEEIEEIHGYACWWKLCKHLRPNDEGRFELQYAYNTLEKWLAHIEDDHLYPIAMKYQEAVSAEIKKLLKHNIIRKSTSNFINPTCVLLKRTAT